MEHRTSPEDEAFRTDFENLAVSAEAFGHAAHVRLAYVYLCGATAEDAYESMRDALRAFLRHLGADPGKYHETLTRSWILAVRHFMEESAPCSSAAEFVERNPSLLDSKLMLKHYSAEVLFSSEARDRFVDPDIASIPEH